MTSSENYDTAVLGGGPGGLPAAKQAAKRGKKVCLIEQNHLGGVCLNVGCMSTKAILHASGSLFETSKFDELGFSVPEIKTDGRKFMNRIAEVVEKLRNDTYKALSKYENITLLEGRGRFTGKNSLAVEMELDGEKQIRAESIIIATGANTVMPDFLPWESSRLWTSNEALTAEDLPKSILIMGGGVIGCEFACMYAELGIETVLVEMKERLLDLLEDEDVSNFARDCLTEKGVKVITGAKVENMQADENEIVTTLPDGGEFKTDHALIAVGRKANVKGINLDSAGVKVEGDIIPVDTRCRTNVENIFAAGDVAENRQYTHLANRMGLVAGDNAAGYENCDDRKAVPIGIYLHPNIALVGLTERQAKQKGEKVKVLESSYSSSGTAIAYNKASGKVKLCIDNETGIILGCAWIGPHSTDMIHEVALAMRNELTVTDIYRTIHAHPTFAEIITDAIEPWIRDKGVICRAGEL